MSLASLSAIADLVAAIGVIVSLLFVAFEVRRNTTEIKRTNWEAFIDRASTFWSRAYDPTLADVLVRGRKSYAGLPEAEKLMFWNYHMELCMMHETLIVLGRSSVQGDDITSIPEQSMRYFFGFPGAREWWNDFTRENTISPLMVEAVEKAIGSRQPGSET